LDVLGILLSKRWEDDARKYLFRLVGLGNFMVFNATFNNISVISWQSVLLVEETVVP
jgi:hypothetical protein